MYDNFIKRLREVEEMLKMAQFKEAATLIEQSADAIEELSVIVRAQKAVLDKFPRWISVTERLPEVKEIVQITDGINVGHGYLDGTWYSPFCDIDVEHISHWMLLPEPPKEK